LSFGSTSPVTLSKAGSATATLTISTTAASSAVLDRPMRPWPGSGVALACILLCGLFVRRRRWPAMLGLLLFAALVAGGVSGCVSGNSGAGSGGGGGNPGTAAGAYQVTVTASSGSVTAQTTINVQVN
jgi:hypothetical protein